MAKLSPPTIAGSLPAFNSVVQGRGIELSIPFTPNRAVDANKQNFKIKIKTVKSSTDIAEIDGQLDSNNTTIVKSCTALNLPQFRWGQYYKIQLAYVDNGETGYYSSVGIAKYTAKPQISITNLELNTLNSHMYTYTGTFASDDPTERVYFYRFDLYDDSGKLISSSGNLLHDSSNDNSNSTSDTYTFTQDLLVGSIYRIKYSVITTNNLEVSSSEYRIAQKQSISPEINASLHAVLNFNNGYIDINMRSESIVATTSGLDDQLASGSFIVSRACEDTNYTVWDEIHRFSLSAEVPTRHLCRDFTIEQGKNYRYGIQQYNARGLRSSRILSNIVYADFEDAFLFDGHRQLKIKYNPKVSSFKKDLLETKTDTIGGKHPFIFRNGRVYYSEFPISGLISYQMDEENLFLAEKDYGLTEKTTNLTGENIAAERLFKMKVLEWLTNGEPKVYRSPTEGNFIVRLMNSSLSPNDTLGRMLHTFSSTAYEIADYNYTSLGEMGFITIQNEVISSLQWETVELAGKATNSNLLKHSAKIIRFDSMMPGEVITLIINGKTVDVKIGATGSYYIDIGTDISQAKLQNASQGLMTYAYNYTREPAFNFIDTVDIVEVPQQQFIGKHNIMEELLYIYDEEGIDLYGNKGIWVKNPKLELISIYSLDIEKRPLHRTTELNNSKLKDPFTIYERGNITVDEGTMPSRPKETFTLIDYYDGYNNKIYNAYDPSVSLNNTVINVNEKEYLHYSRPDIFTSLQSENGVLVTMAYSMGVVTYTIEHEAIQQYRQNNKDHYLYSLGEAINEYNTQLENVKNAIRQCSNSASESQKQKVDTERAKVNPAYNKYIIALIKAQKEESERRGSSV